MNTLKSKQYLLDIERVCNVLPINKLQDKKILVVGGTGLIGGAVVDTLIGLNEKKHCKNSVFFAARNDMVYREKYKHYDFIQFVEYDVSQEMLFKEKVDFVIYCAGISSPELYVCKPVEVISSNIVGINSVLEYARKNAVERVLYVSSSEVYGVKDTNQPYAESDYGLVDVDTLRSSYPIAKRMSEMLCKAFVSEYSVNVIVVRPGHIFGPTASKNDDRIASSFAFKAASGEPLVMKSAGLQKRSYCYCLDCAAAILIALVNGKAGEAYNIGHDEVTSIREMVEILAEAGNVDVKITSASTEEKKAFNPMNNSSLDNRKIKEIGYKDSFSVREGLFHTVQILKEMG